VFSIFAGHLIHEHFSFTKGKAIHFEIPIGDDGHFTLQNTWCIFFFFVIPHGYHGRKMILFNLFPQCSILRMLVAINRAFLKLAPKGALPWAGSYLGECLAP
jgi:hypothetical protein